MTTTKDALPEPAQEQHWYCNKCGNTGAGSGATHNRRDGSQCNYMAASSGPFWSEAQMLAALASKQAEAQAKSEPASRPLCRDCADYEGICPNSGKPCGSAAIAAAQEQKP